MASASRRNSGSSERRRERRRVVITPERSRDGRAEQPGTERTKHTRASDGPGDARRQVRRTSGTRVRDSAKAAREKRLRLQQRAAIARIAFVALVALLLIAGSIGVYRSDLFAIERIVIEGERELSVDEVTERAQVPPESTLLRFPRDEIAERLVSHPWIAAAEVRRRFPQTLVIRIEERSPAALVDAGDAFWLVDSEGYVLGSRAPDLAEPMIIIRDLVDFEPQEGERADSPSLRNALLVLGGLSRELREQVRVISAESVDVTTIVTVNDIEILVGAAEDIARKDAVARTIMQEESGTVVHINVRTVDRPTWRGLEVD